MDVDRDESGKVRGYFSFVTDATERKSAEVKHSASLRGSGSGGSTTRRPSATTRSTSEGRIVSVNRTECEILGYSREEMLGRPIVDFVSEDQRESAIGSRSGEKLRGERPARSRSSGRTPAKDGRQAGRRHPGEVSASTTTGGSSASAAPCKT